MGLRTSSVHMQGLALGPDDTETSRLLLPVSLPVTVVHAQGSEGTGAPIPSASGCVFSHL